MDAGAPLRDERCPLCGGPNGCVPAGCGSFDAPCWCERLSFAASLLERVPSAARNRACICASCATGAMDASLASEAGSCP